MNKHINVCLLNDSFPPVIDGVANAVSNYARVIQEKLGSAVVATPYYPQANDSYSFDVVRYPSARVPYTLGYRLGMPFAGKIVRQLKPYDPDIIHSHCPFASMWLSKALRKAAGAPIIMTYHTKFDIDIATTINSKLLHRIVIRHIVSNIEACDEVWVVSPGAGENLKSLGYQGAMRVMGNGVDFPKGRASDSDIDALNAEHKLSKDEPVFLFVGRLMWYKGIKTILDGLRIVKSNNRAFKMFFVGNGTDSSDIEAYASKLGLYDNCVFTGSVSDREKLRAYYSRADLFLFPSNFDTDGIVVREAAACELPSLLIRGSSAADGIIDGENGALIDDTAESLAACVSLLLQNREKLQNMGNRAMNDLYISWDDSVSTAYARYGEVLREYRQRCRIPKRTRTTKPNC